LIHLDRTSSHSTTGKRPRSIIFIPSPIDWTIKQDEQNDGEKKSIFEFMKAELKRHGDDDDNDDKFRYV
jgi:hypothetical protein